MLLQIKRLHPSAKLPLQATPNSVGLDLFALLISDTGRTNTALIPPRNTRMIRTGIACSPPQGYALFVCSRSGLAYKESLFVTNAPGVVDPDYTGEIMVLLYNGGIEPYYVKHEDRIAQLVMMPCAPPLIDVVENLQPSIRGDAGFGSTGR